MDKRFTKLTLITLTFLLSVQQINAQWYVFKKKNTAEKTVFQKDENGKIIFYETVDIKEVSRDTLWENGLIWVKSLFTDKADKITFESKLHGSVEAELGFMVYIPSIISKIPHGKITYKLTLQVVKGAYSYTFTDFVFQYYRQDRQDLKYKPVKKSIRPLEKEKYPGYQDAWDNHRAYTKRLIEGQIKNLKEQMAKR